MRVWRGKILLLVSVFFMILMACTGANVWAEDETISISISDDSVVMNLMQGEFGEESQIITAWTSNEAGYTVGMRTTGTSSALTNVTDDDYTIPTLLYLLGLRVFRWTSLVADMVIVLMGVRIICRCRSLRR